MQQTQQTEKVCPNCGSKVNTVAKQCPYCKHYFERSVSIWLFLGILLAPILFGWFTLRPGYSATVRVLTFTYLVISFILGAMIGTYEQQNQSQDPWVSNSVIEKRVLPPQEESEMLEVPYDPEIHGN